jgi:hypothetical protein
MQDLPAQALLQQTHARPVSGEELEVLGKQAADIFRAGSCDSLSDAVVETVKKAGLSPEQVKRVIEFANTDTYIKEFNKEGQEHKFIEFLGGPADPSAVLKDLNDGGGGTVFDPGTNDYSHPPPEPMRKTAAPVEEMTKTADVKSRLLRAASKMGGDEFQAGLSAGLGIGGIAGGTALVLQQKRLKKEGSADFDPVETAYEEMWDSKDPPIAYENPYEDAIAMRDKLAGAFDHVDAELSGLETMYMDISGRLYEKVKQAYMNETPLGHIVQAWSTVTDEPEFIKAAFRMMTPHLLRQGVVGSKTEMAESIEKTKTAMVDRTHPLVVDFDEFCQILTKLAEKRLVRQEVAEGLEVMETFIKQAAKVGILPKVFGGARRLAEPVGRAGTAVGEALGGTGSVLHRYGHLAGAPIAFAPHVAGLAAGEAVYQRAKVNPWVRTGYNIAMSRVPYTRPYLIRQYKLQHQY